MSTIKEENILKEDRYEKESMGLDPYGQRTCPYMS
jgi:hypothetical protein